MQQINVLISVYMYLDDYMYKITNEKKMGAICDTQLTLVKPNVVQIHQFAGQFVMWEFMLLQCSSQWSYMSPCRDSQMFLLATKGTKVRFNTSL